MPECFFLPVYSMNEQLYLTIKSGTEHFHALVPDADADFQPVKTNIRGLSIHTSFILENYSKRQA